MKDKAAIVQRLLDQKVITAEEAVVLLKENSNITYIPGSPYYIGDQTGFPPNIWCQTSTNQ